jgi:hypothetical protein
LLAGKESGIELKREKDGEVGWRRNEKGLGRTGWVSAIELVKVRK